MGCFNSGCAEDTTSKQNEKDIAEITSNKPQCESGAILEEPNTVSKGVAYAHESGLGEASAARDNNLGGGLLPRPTNKNGRRALRVKTKNKIARGCVDANTICEAVLEAWEDLEDAMKELNDEERKKITDHLKIRKSY